jgi:hypothetical protein
VSERLLLSLWRQHAAWAEVAARLRARRTWWRTAVLILTIGGAALQTLAIALENTGIRRCVGTMGVLALLAVALLSARFLTPSETRRWLRSRSVSEGVKSEIYAYRAGADAWRASSQMAPSAQWSAFVQACEEVISAESRGWMAKINQEPIAAAPATTLPPLPMRFRRLSRR